MITPTSTEIREWSQLDFDGRGYPADAPDPLDLEVERAAAYVEQVTGLVVTEVAEPSGVATRLKQAIQLRTEQQVIWRSDDYVGDQNESAIDITVTGYSQRRVGTKEQRPRDMINPWPELNDLLMGLLTDGQREYWIGLGVVFGTAPAEVITEHQWYTDTPYGGDRG